VKSYQKMKYTEQSLCRLGDNDGSMMLVQPVGQTP